MSYSPWGHKEWDTTERLILSEGVGINERLICPGPQHTLCCCSIENSTGFRVVIRRARRGYCYSLGKGAGCWTRMVAMGEVAGFWIGVLGMATWIF